MRAKLDAHELIRWSLHPFVIFSGEETQVITDLLSWRSSWYSDNGTAPFLTMSGITRPVLNSAVGAFIEEACLKIRKMDCRS